MSVSKKCEGFVVVRNVQDLLTLVGMSYFRIILYVGHVVNLLCGLLFVIGDACFKHVSITHSENEHETTHDFKNSMKSTSVVAPPPYTTRNA